MYWLLNMVLHVRLERAILFYLFFSLKGISKLCAHACRSTPEGAGTPGASEGDGGRSAPNLTSNRRLQQTQAQVDEVRKQGLLFDNTALVSFFRSFPDCKRLRIKLFACKAG